MFGHVVVFAEPFVTDVAAVGFITSVNFLVLGQL
jgi:hypothetical protein